MNWKTIRITLLLVVLAYVAFDTFWSNAKATDWKRSLRVVIYPINADGSEKTDNYISTLTLSDFELLNTTLSKQGSQYNIAVDKPLRIDLAPTIKELPPSMPIVKSGLEVLWWSIKFRFWSWKTDNYTGIKPQIKSYALYYDPKTHTTLKHSTGLQKAKLAVNHLFADKNHTQQNNVVILHELLHTLGATDKYDLATGLPYYPQGFAKPNLKPRYPQKKAEIMGGLIPITQSEAKLPANLKEIIIGPITTEEIGWIKNK